MWKKTSVFNKTVASFLMIFIFNGILVLIWNSHTRQKESVQFYQSQLLNNKEMIDASVIYSNGFLIKDLVDTNFYAQHTSENNIGFIENIELFQKGLVQLKINELASLYDLYFNLDAIEQKVHLYYSSFDALKEMILKKGFYNYGIEGKMRNYIHTIENDYSNIISMSEVLALRRHEKDYLMRTENKYIKKFESKMGEIETQLKASIKSDSIESGLEILEKYHYAFKELVAINNIIYNKEDGMYIAFEAQTQELMDMIKVLKAKVSNESSAHLSRIMKFYWALTICFILLTITIIYFLAKGLTIPIVRLNKGVSEFIESDFKVKTFPKYRDRKDELGVLSNSFYYLQKEIADTFKNYREEAEEKQNKLLRQNEKIEIQKFLLTEHRATLQETNKRVQDSLDYALKIQSNLMNDFSELEYPHLDISIWYQPKDTVSGDFYWFFENENSIFIALADCTGHGVPGAFMSVLGISFLNAAVIDNNIKEPNKILEFVNNKIITLFNSENKPVVLRDSMDMILLRIEKESFDIIISSANKDFVIVQKGEVKRIKSSRCSVGSSRLYNIKNMMYDNLYYDAQNLDAIYLYSDGIVDQFGDENNKKFKFKRMEEILKTHRSSEEAVAQLKKTLLKWKGSYEQTDDISLIAIGLDKHKEKVAEMEKYNEFKIA